MKVYSENNFYKLYQGNMLNMLEEIQENSIDSIVTDPPYELNFMGKGWDNAGISFQADTWRKCYEVLKPGGYLLAFGGSRTFHRIACAIEDAGFEIRDTIMWLYGSGFPKSMDIEKALNKRDGVEFKSKPASGVGFMNTNDDGYHNTIHQLEQIGDSSQRAKQWRGWGTCLKPSFEPIIVARKPFKGNLIDNVIEYGVGGINIDECRVGNEVIKGGTMPDFRDIDQKSKEAIGIDKLSFGQVANAKRKPLEDHTGRFPANTILTYDETDFDEVCGGFPNTKNSKRSSKYNKDTEYTNTYTPPKAIYTENNTYGDSGSASRYFYCAKASKKDRDEGCQELEDTVNACSNQAIAELKRGNDNFSDETNSTFNKVYKGKNTHPTVKPCDLMQYLVRLVTPNGGTVLDPFNGSGSTGKAVMYENKERDKGYKYIGIELTEDYLPISRARIEYVCKDLQVVQESLDLSDLD